MLKNLDSYSLLLWSKAIKLFGNIIAGFDFWSNDLA